jgi:hypothetical protein
VAQYAIRKIPPELDRALKKRAKQLGKSVNQLVLDALAAYVGQPPRFRDLARMPHPMTKAEHRALQVALEEQRQIDSELWQ